MRKLFAAAAIFTIAFLSAATCDADPWLSNTQTLAADFEDQSLPAVAYNSVHNEYLVVWHADVSGEREIVGIRVDSDGLPIGSSFAISEAGTDQFQPDVAYDPAHDRYFVVWVSDYSGDFTDTDIAGRFIPWDGPNSALATFGINGALTGQWTPSVVLNPGIGEFLVVWGNLETGTPAWISAQRWATDGTGAVTSALDITSGPEYRINPKVAWNDVESQYLVVYERFIGGNEEDVYGTRLTWAGAVLGSEIGIAGWPDEESQVDVASCRGEYMVVWKGGIGSESQVYVRAVTGSGSAGPIVSNLSGITGGDGRPTIACSASGAEVLVAYDNYFGTGHLGVGGALLDLDATITAAFNIYAVTSGGTLDFTRPALAFDEQGVALIAWESDRPDLTSQDIRGRLLGGRLFADGFESGDDNYWSDN